MKALVTSASRKLPLLQAIQDQLDAAAPASPVQVIAGDSDAHCLAAYSWEGFWHMPRLDEDPARTLAAILDQGFDLVIPTRDADVAFLAGQRDALALAGVHCLVASPEAVRTCRDKLAFSTALDEAGLLSIPTATDPGDARLGATRLAVKERFGAGSLGVALDVTHDEAVRAAAALTDPVFQPFVPGPELSLDAYRTRDGRLLGIIARSRDVVLGGESAVTTTVDPHPYRHLAHRLLDTLDVQGHAVVQVILGPEGPTVVECNARLGGASTLSLAAGLRSISWFALEARDEDPAALPFTPHVGPLRLVRIPHDVIGDVTDATGL